MLRLMEVFGRGFARRGIATADMAVRLALAKRPKQFPELGTPRTHREFSARENPRVFAPSKCSHDFAIGSCNLKLQLCTYDALQFHYFCKSLLIEFA